MLAGRWKKMNIHRKRVFAAAMAVAVASTSLNVASFVVNADSSKDGRVITAFEELDSDVAYQYLPVGALESDIVFPEELKVTVYSSEIKPEEPAPAPENPESPEPATEPVSPEAPETPEVPETPGVPETPEAPEAPAEPETPEAPVEPAGPETPETPENPGETGEGPVEPENPGSVEEPENPGNEGSEEGSLSGAIRELFGTKTVYAAEGGEGGEGESGEPVTEEGQEDGKGEEGSETPEVNAPAEPAPADEGNTDVQDPGTGDETTPADPAPAADEGTTGPGTSEEEEEPGVTGSGDEKVLSNVEWKLVRDLSTYRRFEALLEGDVFVYEPDLSVYPLTVEAEVPQIRVTITAREEEESLSGNETVSGDEAVDEASYPEFSRVMITGGVRIRVEAPEGVFPEGAELSVKKLDDPAAAEKLKGSVGEGAGLMAFDITIKDLSGNEIQPRTENGLVKVTFENVGIVKDSADKEGAEVSVYHFEDGLEGGQKMDADVNAPAGSASVEAGHFSTFVLVVEGGEEAAGDSALPSMPENEILGWLLKNGWIKVNGVNSGKEARPNGYIFDTISDEVKTDKISGNDLNVRFVIVGDNDLDPGEVSGPNAVAEKYSYSLKTTDSKFGIKIKLYKGASYINEVQMGVYPKYEKYDYRIDLNPSSPRSVEFNKDVGNQSDKMEKGINDVKFWLQEGTNKVEWDMPNALSDKKYKFFRVEGVTKDQNGDYVLPADPAYPQNPGKDSYKYTSISATDVKEPGIYAAGTEVTIPLNVLPGTEDVYKFFRNTVSADAGGLNGSLKLTGGEKGVVSGNFFRITTISIDKVIKEDYLKVSSGTVPYESYKNGYEIFSLKSTFDGYPPLNDPDENIRYIVTKKGTNTIVKSGLVADNPLPRIMEPGEYEISFDASGSVHYKGKYGPVDSLKITGRDLSDKTHASMTVSPNRYTVKSAEDMNPVKAPVTVTWKSDGSGLKETLTEGEDYTLTYKNNDRPGTATVTVSGTGIYTGKMTGTFDIIVNSKVPVIRFREEYDMGQASEKQKEWYNTGVKLSAKPEGTLNYDVRLGTEGEYAQETEPFKEEGEKVEANLYLRSSSNPPTYYNLPQFLNIDLTDPKASINVDGTEYSGLKNDGMIGIYTSKAVKATADGSDELSGIGEFGYYITDSESVKTLNNLKNMSDGEWISFASGSELPVKANKKTFIYVRAKDKAGNTGFSSAKGICYDTVAPTLSKAASTAVNNRLNISFTASDALSGVGKYYALVLNPTDAEPTADVIMKHKKAVVSEDQPLDVGKVSGVKAIYCVVVDRAGNVSAVKRVNTGNDKVSPTGSIKIMDKTWNEVQSEKKVAAYTREKQLITITGSDPGSGVKRIDYCVSQKCYTTASSIAGISANLWKTYSDADKPEIEHNVLNYVYARISDNSGNLGYVSTEGVWHDTIVPKNNSIETSKIKDTSLTVTLKGTDDESGIGEYYALVKKADQEAPDNKAVEASGTRSEKDTFEVKGLAASNTYKVYGIIKDKAGNLSEVKSAVFSTTKAAGGSSSSGSGASSKSGSSGKSASSKDKAKAAADSYRQQNGINSGTKKSGDILSTVPMPSRIPFIVDATEGIAKGEELTSGWNRIGGESVKAKEASEMYIQMNGATVVPVQLLKYIANRNITVYFLMNDDCIWAMNGLSFTEEPTKDLDLRIRKDTKNIPADMVNKVADIYPHMTISLEHDGDFGCKAILSLPFGVENTGMYANLYYYNSPGARINFVDSSPVDDKGRTEFEFTHASDYLVVLRGDALTDQTAFGTGAEEILPGAADETVIMPKNRFYAFFSPENRSMWILLVTILSLALCAVVVFMPDDKKRKMTE